MLQKGFKIEEITEITGILEEKIKKLYTKSTDSDSKHYV